MDELPAINIPGLAVGLLDPVFFSKAIFRSALTVVIFQPLVLETIKMELESVLKLVG
jgi:hypothetical protein